MTTKRNTPSSITSPYKTVLEHFRVICQIKNSKINFFQNKSPPLRPTVNTHTLSLCLFVSPTSFPTASSILYNRRRPIWHPLFFVLSFIETAALGFACQALFPLLAIIFYISYCHVLIGFLISHLFSNTVITLRIRRFALRKSTSTVSSPHLILYLRPIFGYI